MPSQRFLSQSVFVCIGIIIAGFFVATFFTHQIDTAQRARLLQQTKSASLFVSTADVASLAADNSDLTNPTYQRLKNAFVAFRSFNPDVRFLYLMGYRPEVRTQFFYVDSEDPSSKDYSPPGQLFPDTRKEDIDRYLAGSPYTDGPYRDSWGEWVSGYVPITNESGVVVAMIGIDVATTVWHAESAFVYSTVGSIAALLCLLSIGILRAFHRREASIESLTLKNRALSQTEHKLRDIQQRAQIGAITFQFPAGVVTFDQALNSLFKNTQGRLTLEGFFAAIHPDDVSKAKEAFDELRSSDILYTWFDVRIGTFTEGYRRCHISGDIERDPTGAPKRYSAIIQDITDIA